MVHDLLTRTESELAGLVVAGFANAGPGLSRLAALAALAGDLSAAGLGKLGDRLCAVGEASDERARLAAWAAAWSGIGLVRTRLLKPVALEVPDGPTLPHAPAVLFPWPLASPVPVEGEEGELDELLAALQCAQPLARAYAAGRLASLGDVAVAHLLAVQQQAGRCIRFLVVETLGRIASDAALAGLIGLLGDADVARPVEAALLALGERSVAPLAEALAQAEPKDKSRRRATAKLLWRLGAAPRLEAYLRDGDKRVAAYAQAALWPAERLVERAQQKAAAGLPAAVALFEQQRPERFDDLAGRIDALPKNRLADAAGVVRHTGAEPPLLAHYMAQMTAGRNKKVRAQALAFVARLGNPATLPALVHMMEANSSPQLAGAHQVANGLAELADPTAVWPLIRAAQSITQTLFHYWRTPWIAALGRIGDLAAAPALLEMLHETNVPACRAAIESALVAIGAPAAEAVGQALLAPNPAPATAATLERALMKIEAPQAQAALAAYRVETSELTRVIAHLTDGIAAEELVEQAAALGAEALEPLLGLLAEGPPLGQDNAARALAKLAPKLAAEQREQAVDAFRAKLRTLQPSHPITVGWSGGPMARHLVKALGILDVGASVVPEIRDVLMITFVGDVVVECWRQTRRPWLLDVIVQGIQAPHVRYHALSAARHIPLDETTRPRLWPLVESVVQNETGFYPLSQAVACLRAWGDVRALPLLQALQNRVAAVTGNLWERNSLNKQLEAALAELGQKRSRAEQ